jgi:hypothetical protein
MLRFIEFVGLLESVGFVNSTSVGGWKSAAYCAETSQAESVEVGGGMQEGNSLRLKFIGLGAKLRSGGQFT